MQNFQHFKFANLPENVITHEWGQNAASVYNILLLKYNKLKIGQNIFIKTNVNLGSKNLLKFLQEQGLNAELVGKGTENLRVIEVIKSDTRKYVEIKSEKMINFTFNNKQYQVTVGNSRFSKTDLDIGTRFLLDKILTKKIDLNGANIADLGAGWGAISIVLSNEFKNLKITGFETDMASIEAYNKNIEKGIIVKNTRCSEIDLCQDNIVELKDYEGKFDYIVSNPPFHVTAQERNSFFKNAKALLKVNGELYVCIKNGFLIRFRNTIQKHLTVVEMTSNEEWTYLKAVKVS